ncbi:MAG TPA: VWA domain-containing protein [Lacipirellulaceae bacterium]|nr:VWA domain-containing protein [Lacipirellulaceae bacterium]
MSATSHAEAATWQLDSRWSWAPWATLLLILVAIAWTIAVYSRESGSAGRIYRAFLVTLRLVAIGLVLVMIAQWALALWLTGPPAIALVIDHSASMGITDHYDHKAESSRLNERLIANGLSEPTRLNIAKVLLKQDNGRFLDQLAARYRLAAYAVAGDVVRLAPSGSPAELGRGIHDLSVTGSTSQATRIGDALLRALDDSRGAPPAAVILLSDGNVTQGISLADAADSLRSAGVPLLAVGIGSAKPPRDIELADVLVDEAVFVNDVVSLQAQIKATGLEGQPAKVVLRREGVSKPIAEKSIVLPATGKTLSVQLTDRPTKPGDVKYIVEVSTRADETKKDNNRQLRTVEVRDQKIRVLLAVGYPNYEFRYLKTLLERDHTIQLSTYLQDADPEYAEQDKTALRSFPLSRDELFKYDVLIIGDLDPGLLPASVWQSVRAFVAEKGGGAAFVAGSRFLPAAYRDNRDIAALLPVSIDSLSAPVKITSAVPHGFSVRPTPLGLQNPAMQLGDSPDKTQQVWNKLAPLYWIAPVGQLKPGAQILAEAAGKPAICFQYYGAGRVLFDAIDATWRWRIGAGERYFARYWVQMIRFLAHGELGKGRGMELTCDRREYQQGETAQLRARFLDAKLAPTGGEVVVLVDAPGQARRRVTLRRNPSIAGIYEGTIPDLTDGRYSILMIQPELRGHPPAVQFSVVAPPGEFARTEMNANGLAAAAEATHGKFYTTADMDHLSDNLPAGRRVPTRNLPPIPIWNRWWILAVFLGCLTAEWILRKRKGML